MQRLSRVLQHDDLVGMNAIIADLRAPFAVERAARMGIVLAARKLSYHLFRMRPSSPRRLRAYKLRVRADKLRYFVYE